MSLKLFMIFPQKKQLHIFGLFFFPMIFPQKWLKNQTSTKLADVRPGKAMIPPGSLIIDFAVPHVSEAARR